MDSQAIPVARMSQEAAGLLAAEALGFVARDNDRLQRFLDVSGLDPATIRSAAETPAFLIGVLDYVDADQALLAAFSIEHGCHPTAVAAALAALVPANLEKRAHSRRAPGPLKSRCLNCRNEKALDRQQRPNVPGCVAVIEVARCGPCGGGLDVVEEWLDSDGNGLVPY